MKKIILLILLAFAFIFLNDKVENTEIPSTSIRVRVIASGNTEKEQKDKIIVKAAIIEYLESLLSTSKTYDETEEKIINNIPELEKTVENTLLINNINYNYEVQYGNNFFPEKVDKGFLYHAGNYKSLVVTLGKGAGENWWCVLYPPICQINENVSDHEYHSLVLDSIKNYN